MHLLVNSFTSKLSFLAQAQTAEQSGTAGVLLFFLATVAAVLVNIGKDNALSAKIKRAFNITDQNWGMMFGLFVFGLLMGALPNLFVVLSEEALSENAISGFRVSGLMFAIFSGLYLVFRVLCESSKVREPEQAWRLAVVASVTILGALYIGVRHGDDDTITEKFKLGVDLAGGVNLVYKITPEMDAEGEVKPFDEAAMQGLLSALGRRLNPGGTLDLILRPYGNNTHVEIVVPNATSAEIAHIKEVITNTGALEFMVQVDGTASESKHQTIRDAVEDSFESTYNTRLVRDDQGEIIGRWVKVGTEGDYDKKTLEFLYNARSAGEIKRVFYQDENGVGVAVPVLLTNGTTKHFDSGNEYHRAIQEAFENARSAESAKEFTAAVLPAGVTRIDILMIQPKDNVKTTGDDLKSVRSTYDGNLRPSVAFTMNATSAGKFGRFTGQNINEQLSIVLDGNLLSSANINSRISKSGVIEGDFTQARVDQIIGILRAGKLPGTLDPIPESENKMGASLGTATIAKGKMAIGLSLVVVLLFMIVCYFGVPGFVAAFALVLNLVLILAVMVMIGASFTLSGMAGLVLTVGMAVDANVLIFERIREELADGARVKAAIRNGFSRATITIIDANLTTMITGVLLYAIGTDQIRGFAITLILGIIMSMFTAIYASRGIFVVAAGLQWIKSESRSLRPKGTRSIVFMSKAKIAGVISTVVILVGLIVTFDRGSEMLAIDLSGGSSAIFVLSDNATDAEAVEDRIRAYAEDNNVTHVDDNQESHKFQFNVTSVELDSDGVVSTGWRVNTNLTDQDKLESVLGAVFSEQLQQQSINVEIVDASNPTETQSSAVERVLPQFVSYQEDDLTEEATVEEATVEEATVEEGPALPVTETGPQPEAPTTGTNDDVLPPSTDDGDAPAVSSTVFRIDFAVGGESVALKDTDLESMINAAASSAGFEVAGNVQGGSNGEVTVYGLEGTQAETLKTELLKDDGKFYFEETQKFGAQIAGDMKTLGAMAIIFSFIGIVTYIWLRFQHVSFGIAAVVALVHDVLVTLAAISVSTYLAEPLGFAGIEDFKISLPVIAAFLTIIGYSLNDTIVVFDRVREVRGKSREITADMLDRSVNSTLRRTLLTSATTLIVVGLLYGLGGSGIHSFAFALVIGVIVGTYSSIFVASPTLLLLNRKK